MAKEFILPFSELKGTLVDTPNEPTLEITENGVYNVKGYVYADVNVEGGGGSSDLNNPIELELVDGTGDYARKLITKLTVGEIYNLCKTGTPYFTVSEEQLQTYSSYPFKPDTKYFINDYAGLVEDEIHQHSFNFVMLGIVDTTDDNIATQLILEPQQDALHIIIASGL